MIHHFPMSRLRRRFEIQVSRSCCVFRRRYNIKRYGWTQPTREELQARLTAANKKNNVLTSHIETIQEENTELKSHVGSVEAQMKMFKDAMVNQLNISLPQNGSGDATPSTHK